MNSIQPTNLRTGLSFFLLVILAGCATLPSPSITTNVPSSRLTSNTYASPDGEYTVALPPLMKPGARIEERQISPVGHGIFFADDFGKAYYILRTDNTKTQFTIEQISDDFKVGELLREKQFVTTDQGKELRLVGINKGGSPIVSRTKENGEWVERKNDLYEAWSIFLHGIHIYQVTAGVTSIQKESETVLFDRGKINLEEFLKGLHIRPSKQESVP
jgi:hypothetical protein